MDLENKDPRIPEEESIVQIPAEEPAPQIPAEEPAPQIPVEEPAPQIPAEEPAPQIPAEESILPPIPEESTLSFDLNAPLNLPFLEADDWLDKVLVNPAPSEELQADETAVAAAGLTHPDDLELEKIMAEDWDSVPLASEDVPQTANQAPEVADTNTTPPGMPEQETAVIPQEIPTQPDAPVQEALPATELPDDGTRAFIVPNEAESTSPVSDETRQVSIPQDQKLSKKKKKAAKKEALPEEPPVEDEAPIRKRRPKHKKGYGLLGIPHILSTVIWLALIVAIGVSLGRTIWLCCADLMAFGKRSQEVTITITSNDDIDSVSEKLGNAGLVRYPGLFKFFAEITGKEERISQGTFTLNSHLDYNAMINAMGAHAPAREVVTVMIPEGYTCAQIFALLAEKQVCTVEDLEAYCVDGELDEYWFLEGVARGDKYCLEGYLFPDTYEFYTNDTPRRVIEKFLNAFDNRFTDVMKERLDPLNERLVATLRSRGYGDEYIEAHKITIREIVIIASMIEEETSGADESYTIASVIYNRLTNPANYPYLNIDATLYYYLGGNIDPETGNRMPLTNDDLLNDHPYNTYTRTGLIPGPISNPGRDSLNAALEPMESNYYYYVYSPNDGKHLFAKDESGHQKNVNKVNSQR